MAFGILCFILLAVQGLILWTGSELPLVWRETAINSRKEDSPESEYKLLKVLPIAVKILAVLVWIFAVASLFIGPMFHQYPLFFSHRF